MEEIEIQYLQERINQIKGQEYRLTRAYADDNSEANWNALCDIRRHGQLQEELKELADRTINIDSFKSSGVHLEDGDKYITVEVDKSELDTLYKKVGCAPNSGV